MENAKISAPAGLASRRLSFSMPMLMAAVVVVSMTTLGGLLMWQGWMAAKRALTARAHDNTLAMGERIDSSLQRRLLPGLATLYHLARSPLMKATNEEERLRSLPLLAEVLTKLPVAASVYAGYTNGDFFLMRAVRTPADTKRFDAPPETAYLVQSITREADGPGKDEWLFYDRDLHLIERRSRPPSGFDPRTRSWYKGAVESAERFLTRPYVFFTTKELGLTQSSPAPNGRGVVALEQNLSDLATILEGLRLTPRTELALVGEDGQVYSYFDFSRIHRQAGDEERLTSVDHLGVPALADLVAEDAPAKQTVHFEAGGEPWFGITVPLVSFPGRDVNLVVAIPDADLLESARAHIARQFLWSLGLMAVLLVMGWFVGRQLGRSLTRLNATAENLANFNFHAPPPCGSRIREIEHLDAVLRKMCVTIQNFLTTAETIGTEPGLDRMLVRVLDQMVAATGCRTGAVYLLHEQGQRLVLTAWADETGAHALEAQDGRGRAAPAGSTRRPFAAELPPDALDGPASCAAPMADGVGRFTLPLMSRHGMPVGLLLLDHPTGVAHSGDGFQAFTGKLSGALSAAIETRQLFEAQKQLLDGFVLLIADAIDAKSPYTGAHCRRVPELATMIVDRMSGETSGPFADFRFTEAQRYEFHLGAWLHDCGKVTSPEHIIDKATKLEAIHNRIHEIRTRFEVLWRDTEIDHLKRLAAGADMEASKAERDKAQASLQGDFAFIAACNVGGEFMTEEAVARVREIARRTWLRHFDDRLGLSLEEQRRLDPIERQPLPATEQLLADRAEHVVPWGAHRPPVEKGNPANIHGFDMKLPEHRANLGEIYNLSIGRGTLTPEDRFKINDHIVQTYAMLKSLPWPDHLARVPEIAATHHERMDGKGYPRRLTDKELPTPARVMVLADIFEALTASDRPYKPAKTLSQSLRIMAFICKEGHIDPVIFRYFLESRIWEAYAARYLAAEQRDAVDLDALLALILRETVEATA